MFETTFKYKMNYSKDTSYNIAEKILKGDLKVSVIGLGRIGLPTAVILAQSGIRIYGVDIDENVVNNVNRGVSQFEDEPELNEILSNVVQNKKLTATKDASEVVSNADVIIVCVPTPVTEAKIPDYSYISTAAQEIGKSVKKGALVIIESTVGPGVVEDLVRKILEKESGYKVGADFGLASCPERADPGNIILNMKKVPRIVGGSDRNTTEAVSMLYQKAMNVEVVKVSSPKVANAAKLTENLYRDVNIALANEFALLYEKLGIDSLEVINACSTKYNFMPHYPGAGVGGPCLPSNPYYLIVEAVKVGNIPYLIRMAREINDRMPDYVVNLVSETLNEIGRTVKNTKIAVLGITYKPDVKDIQLSPIESIIAQLKKMGAEITIYDPYFKGEEVYRIRVAESIENAVKDIDCILVGTAHKEFLKINPQYLIKLGLNHIALVDTRQLISPELARKFGFVLRGVGRPKMTHLK
jgi:nucleotide sugar dehydrogenase